MKDEGLQLLVSSSTEQKLVSRAQRESSDEEAHIAGVVLDRSIALLDVSQLQQNLGTGRESSKPDLAAGETSYHDADHTLGLQCSFFDCHSYRVAMLLEWHKSHAEMVNKLT